MPLTGAINDTTVTPSCKSLSRTSQNKTIFKKLSGTLRSRGSYGVYVAVTGSTSHLFSLKSLCVSDLHESVTVFSLNAAEWKSTLLGVILGSLRFGVEIHSQNSGIHSK